MESVAWYAKAWFYIVEVGEFTKIGITRNWPRRKAYFEKRFPGKPIRLDYLDQYQHYWQADLVEGIVRERLKPWVYKRTKEWVISELPVACIEACYLQTKATLEPEYEMHECIHWRPDIRYAVYDQILAVLKEKW